MGQNNTSTRTRLDKEKVQRHQPLKLLQWNYVILLRKGIEVSEGIPKRDSDVQKRSLPNINREVLKFNLSGVDCSRGED